MLVGTISDSDSDTSNNTVAENASLGDATNLTAVASDGDTGATIRAYELTDDAGGLFTINPTTGAVTVAGSLDYETATSHTITVKATSTDGDTNTQNFTISVTNVADNTPVLTDNNSAANAVSESASVGATVGVTALATDADTGATIQQLRPDCGGDTFAIDSSTGVVTVKDVGSGATGLNYESAQSHTITVEATASDGQTSTKSYVINVTNVADVAVGTISDSDSDTSNNTVAEGNASLGDATNLTAVASDGDTGATIRAYELTDDAGGLFTINPTTGAVTVAGSLDYETATSHTITVKATSTDGDTNTQNFTISVTNVADNTPVLTDNNSAANTVSESASVGATVGVTALATDADTGATISSYALTAGGDTFAIDSSTGVVTVKDVGSGATELNYESAQSHTITVEATASDGQTSTKLCD